MAPPSPPRRSAAVVRSSTPRPPRDPRCDLKLLAAVQTGEPPTGAVAWPSWSGSSGETYADNGWYLVKRSRIPKDLAANQIATPRQDDHQVCLYVGAATVQFDDLLSADEVRQRLEQRGFRVLSELRFAPNLFTVSPIARGKLVAPITLIRRLRAINGCTLVEPIEIEGLTLRSKLRSSPKGPTP